VSFSSNFLLLSRQRAATR